jgi:hypothetical protein
MDFGITVKDGNSTSGRRDFEFSPAHTDLRYHTALEVALSRRRLAEFATADTHESRG